jgi:glycosyltransferase involved in cell wall biosynthesis
MIYMPSTPLLSIIIPLYNCAPYLELAVKSIFRQDLAALGGPTEILIVNDGSTDGSGEIARDLAAHHPEITVIDQKNFGVSHAMNTGLRQAGGEIITFLDADDEYAAGALAFYVHELAALRQEFGELVMARGLLEYLQHDQVSGSWQPVGSGHSLASMITAAVSRATLAKVGYFDEELRAHEDLDWLLRAADAGIVMPVRERIVLLYRRHDGNTSHNATLMRDERAKMLRKNLRRKRLLMAQNISMEKSHRDTV